MGKKEKDELFGNVAFLSKSTKNQMSRLVKKCD